MVSKVITSTVFSGKLTCLLEANGIGKSTLLRTLFAFQPKLAGDTVYSRKKTCNDKMFIVPNNDRLFLLPSLKNLNKVV
jgi:ABC-type cobalamin/Fe3+-siderophores transport system ATPase subunit